MNTTRESREPARPARQVLAPGRSSAGRPEAVAGVGLPDRPVRRAHVAEAGTGSAAVRGLPSAARRPSPATRPGDTRPAATGCRMRTPR
ncbi:hypothetical protein ACIRFH_12110 [Streptomyces sp. NPDC093586]|uniref:hypothetical protein n=1 Tax=Streptomyces sp. NPDC093586 TaxID=3366042 RepID=UPI00381BB391